MTYRPGWNFHSGRGRCDGSGDRTGRCPVCDPRTPKPIHDPRRLHMITQWGLVCNSRPWNLPLATTTDPESVTCLTCLHRMGRRIKQKRVRRKAATARP